MNKKVAIKRRKSFFVLLMKLPSNPCYFSLRIYLYFYTIPLSICLITVRCMAVAATTNDTITNVKQTNKQMAMIYCVKVVLSLVETITSRRMRQFFLKLFIISSDSAYNLSFMCLLLLSLIKQWQR